MNAEREGGAEKFFGAALPFCIAVRTDISAAATSFRPVAPHGTAAAETENCHASAMVCRSSSMAFFSSLDTCACEIPTSAEISVCVFPS